MKKAVLIFGASQLQKSLIEQAKNIGLFTVALDPNPLAECKSVADVFEVVHGDDFTQTIEVAQKYHASGLVTTATDKPLVMMAKVAEKLNLPFCSVKTATVSTDKYLMKNVFMKKNIPCAKGQLVSCEDELSNFSYPIIVKPRDNSGSRGVVFCNNIDDAKKAFKEAKQFSKKNTLLIEEFIEGKEYSIESLHYQGNTEIIQYTEKVTTPLPYNVEMAHFQPANLSICKCKEIDVLIKKIACALNFNNCASHTELKINKKGIFIIETSPRLGGDFITSKLVPLSTGYNIEKALLEIALGESPREKIACCQYSGILYLDFYSKKINLSSIKKIVGGFENNIIDYKIYYNDLKNVPLITNSSNRHGHIIFCAEKKDEFEEIKQQLRSEIGY